MTKIEVTNALRAQYLDLIKTVFTDEADVLQTAAGTIMIPVLDAEQNERWIKVSVIVPKDTDGDDGYALAEEYQLKLQAAEERKAKAKAKAEKDKAKRAKKEAEA